jgi:argininosuccinate lyase
MSVVARTKATGGPLDPNFLAWQTSLPVDRQLLEQDIRGSVAHVAVLEAAKLLSAGEAETLRVALAGLPARVASGDVELPLEEDVHMAVETWLRAAIGEVADKLHTGRSRNDQVVTDFMLWCREACDRLEHQARAVQDAARAWLTANGDVPMPTFTHRQVAIPVLARVWMQAALLDPLERDIKALSLARAELAACPLGAGAIAGSTLPTDPNVAARELGFARAHHNPMDAVGDRDWALSLLFVASRMSLHLSRFSTDIVEMVSDGMVKLGGAIACGSSMMPHKRNPDLFELVRAQAHLRFSELSALWNTVTAMGMGYHRDFQQDKEIAFANIHGVIKCLEMTVLGLGHIELVPERCLQALRDGDGIATDLCEALVAQGMAFRQAYGKIGALVVAQREKGKRLVDLQAADLDAHDLPHSLLSSLDLTKSAQVRAARY